MLEKPKNQILLVTASQEYGKLISEFFDLHKEIEVGEIHPKDVESNISSVKKADLLIIETLFIELSLPEYIAQIRALEVNAPILILTFSFVEGWNDWIKESGNLSVLKANSSRLEVVEHVLELFKMV